MIRLYKLHVSHVLVDHLFPRSHDPVSYISPERAQAMSNMPVPVGMIMNLNPIPPRFYNQQPLPSEYCANNCLVICCISEKRDRIFVFNYSETEEYSFVTCDE